MLPFRTMNPPTGCCICKIFARHCYCFLFSICCLVLYLLWRKPSGLFKHFCIHSRPRWMYVLGRSCLLSSSHYGVPGIIFFLLVKSCSSLSAWISCHLGADVNRYSGSRYPSSMHDILLFILDFRLSLRNKYVIFHRKIDIY